MIPKAMRFLSRWFVLIVMVNTAGGWSAQAQLNNRIFELQKAPLAENGWHAGIQSLGFVRHNQFHSFVSDAYTLAGFQLHPYAFFQANENLRLDIGVFALRDFGIEGFRNVSPTFSITYMEPGVRLILGNLDGALHHRLIEPLQSFERLIDRRQETGLQFSFENSRIFSDSWIDWRKMSRPADPLGANWLAGQNLDIMLLDDGEWSFGLPFQLTLQHFAPVGLDPEPTPRRFLHYSLGGRLAWKGGEDEFLQRFRFESFWVFQRLNENEIYPNDRGQGIYLNLAFENKAIDLLLNYWNGRDYVNPEGGPLFGSVPLRGHMPASYEEERELIFVRFLKDIKLQDGLGLSLRWEPVFDRQRKSWDYTLGFFMTYNPVFSLGKR